MLHFEPTDIDAAIAAFAAAIGKHRHFERQTDPPRWFESSRSVCAGTPTVALSGRQPTGLRCLSLELPRTILLRVYDRWSTVK